MKHLFTYLLVLMLTSAAAQPSASVTVLPDDSIVSVPLNRTVQLTIILPPDYHETGPRLPVLYLNDGQDLPRLHMSDVLDSLYKEQAIRPFVLVAMHANVDRIQEYGTAFTRRLHENAVVKLELTLILYLQNCCLTSENGIMFLQSLTIAPLPVFH